jgi:hypothetical protein
MLRQYRVFVNAFAANTANIKLSQCKRVGADRRQ